MGNGGAGFSPAPKHPISWAYVDEHQGCALWRFVLLVGGGLAFYGLSYTMLLSALARGGVVPRWGHRAHDNC